MSSKPVVLIIEDNESIANMYSDALVIAGFETQIMRDGKLAMEHLNSATPELIILDMNLPHVSGHYILKHIRADERLKRTPIIIATANSVIAGALSSDLTDNDFLLIKPIEISTLQNLARRLQRS